jgi:hypothetical protein
VEFGLYRFSQRVNARGAGLLDSSCLLTPSSDHSAIKNCFHALHVSDVHYRSDT